jgi:GMP synthase (glutamine-hydrolysing)
MRVLVLQHHDVEHPGRLGSTLRDHAFRLDVRRPDRDPDHAFPPDLDDVHALVLMGGPQNVGDGLPWIDRECELVKDAHDADIPVVGVCLGAQIVARALGGEVGPMPTPECGFADVSLTVDAQTDAMMAGIAWRHPQFHFHAQEVTRLPSGATLLASSDRCRNQAFKIGLRTFAFQYHFECDRAMIDEFCRQSPDLLAAAGTGPEDAVRQTERHYETYARLANRLCVNLATYAFPFKRLLAV